MSAVCAFRPKTGADRATSELMMASAQSGMLDHRRRATHTRERRFSF
jgi:hypothetical protein